MFLVAGLAVAVLVGIVAAFYFSIRSGNGGGKRLRPGRAARAGAGRAGAGHAGAGRRPGGRSGSAGHGRTGNTRRTAYGSGAGDASSRDYRDEHDTSPDFAPDSGDPVLAGGRQVGYRSEADETQATDSRLEAVKTSESGPGNQSAARLPREAAADGDPARSRRRMGFRKGAHLDEELWPTETFGGVSDEQFWDDLAADKPLTTTARIAQQDPGTRKQEPGTRKRPLGTGQAADPQAPRANGAGRARAERAREERGRDNGRRGGGSGAYPESRSGPNPATERSMIQPAYAATQPAPTMASQVPTMAPQMPGATQPTETRGRRRASSAEEDPLTSAAFALRASGPVDGRSSLRSGGSHSGGSRSGGDYSGTASYSPAGGSYRDPSPATQVMATPPHGENYGYGSRNAIPPRDGRDRPNGTRNHPRHTRTSEGTRSARQAYPQDSYPTRNRQGTGGYPTNGYQANGYHVGGYPGNGYPGNGQRAAYDPREDYRRLTHRR